MGVSPDQDDLGAVSSLLAQFDTPDESIAFKWAFPNYTSIRYTATLTVTDGTPGAASSSSATVGGATYAEEDGRLHLVRPGRPAEHRIDRSTR